MQLLELQTQIKLNNILLLTDFSIPSEHALPFAVGLSRRFQSRVVLANIVQPPPMEPIPIEPMPLDIAALRLDAEDRMRHLAQSSILAGIEHDQFVLQGPFAETIQKFVQQKEVDLIVLGTHGRAGIKKLLLGSVAEEVFRRAPCPVLTVGPHVAAYAPDRVPHVLFATDFSPASTKALPYAIAMAQENKSEITLMHVIENVPDTATASSRLYDNAMSRLRALLPTDAVNWCEPEFEVGIGIATDELLRAASTRHSGLIVLGTHHAARLSSHIPWAVAYSIVRRADCPVLTVRA